MTLSSPTLAASGPGVILFKDAEGTPEARSDRSAAVPRQTHRQAEVTTSGRSAGETKNNELVVTYGTHMLPRTTQTHTFLLLITGLRTSQRWYSSQKWLSEKKKPIYSEQPP